MLPFLRRPALYHAIHSNILRQSALTEQILVINQRILKAVIGQHIRLTVHLAHLPERVINICPHFLRDHVVQRHHAARMYISCHVKIAFKQNVRCIIRIKAAGNIFILLRVTELYNLHRDIVIFVLGGECLPRHVQYFIGISNARVGIGHRQWRKLYFQCDLPLFCFLCFAPGKYPHKHNKEYSPHDNPSPIFHLFSPLFPAPSFCISLFTSIGFAMKPSIPISLAFT